MYRAPACSTTRLLGTSCTEIYKDLTHSLSRVVVLMETRSQGSKLIPLTSCHRLISTARLPPNKFLTFKVGADQYLHVHNGFCDGRDEIKRVLFECQTKEYCDPTVASSLFVIVQRSCFCSASVTPLFLFGFHQRQQLRAASGNDFLVLSFFLSFCAQHIRTPQHQNTLRQCSQSVYTTVRFAVSSHEDFKHPTRRPNKELTPVT